ncbi:putative bifunctional diguanylate cyclase/phosphodiesterase [Granulicella arctica]|uniref:putative bifunctional diguanylate cyclase/phosphodiesterase n=1 Tax=Granulicella arctica TaxID=940613 RepID=UPI001C54A800
MLSLIVATLASYATLDLVARIRLIDVSGKKRFYWLLGGAAAMGMGIWSMHFIGMLALQMPMQMEYDPWLTGASLLIGICISYFALHVTTRNSLTTCYLFLGGLLMGTGIAAMHYTGMAAMRVHPAIHYRPLLVILSLFIAFVFSWMALWIAVKFQHQRQIILKRCGMSIAMGLAIAGMHYVGMSAAIFPPGAVCHMPNGISQSSFMLILPAFSLCGLIMTLVLSTLDTRFDLLLLRSHLSLEDANKRLKILASVDALTGIPNRNAFIEKTEERLLQAARDGRPFSVMYLDLEEFKNVNDFLGHAAGDELLKAFARELTAHVRSGDFVARLGGDEFVVLLNGLGQPKEAASIATSILDRLRKDFIVQNMTLRITASVGIATYPIDGSSVSALLNNADTAMYAAKQNGRNSYRFFDPAMKDAAAKVLQIYHGLAEALGKNQFSLVFQAKFGGLHNHFIGAEALIRWTHPEMGELSPLEFIATAEQTGQIAQISEWVIGEVCRQMKVWTALGLPPFKVAINLSPEQLRQDRYAERVADIIRKAGIEPQWIMFEVTETVAMREPALAGEVIRQFEQAGFDIALDDFGTGYSSMAYLRQFRVKELKIDRLFISALDGDGEEGEAIVSAIIALAHSLHMTVVAEGVETVSQLKKLKDMGCDQVQGFLLGKPLSPDKFEAFLRRRTNEEASIEKASQ